MLVKRYDRISLPGRIEKTDEGFIHADPVVTRTGVFSYRLKDGTIRKEFRSDEEVFSADALKSAQMIPITDTHPDDFVTPENASSLAIGMTGENARRDGDTVRVPIKITTKAGIAAVEGGRLQLSLGYRCLLERKDGEFQGEKYTHIQRQIQCNHLALCDTARAGAQATLRLDADDAEMVENTKERRETKTMKGTLKLDSLTYECDPEVAVAYEKLAKKHDDATASRDEHKSALDTLQAKHDAQTEEIEKLKAVDNTDAIAKGVAELSKVLEAVKPMVTEEVAKKLDGMTADEMRLEGIKSQFEKFDNADKSDDYRAAMFVAAVEKHADAAKQKQGSDIVGDHSGRKDADDIDLDAKRQEMIDREDGKTKDKGKE